MVLKSKKRKKTVRRRAKIGGENTEESPPTKQQRLTPRAIERDRRDNSNPHGFSPEEFLGGKAGSSSSKLSPRLFCSWLLPKQLCASTFFRRQTVIGMGILPSSQFGKLFQLPVVRFHNSTKLIGRLLCRQLITDQIFELWFTFGHNPSCFSLDNFRKSLA
ncbi:DUF1985 domain-containing protein [Raphanus sativus]|nr:DUF1985 domain-containing protein [Raphanus sativus]